MASKVCGDSGPTGTGRTRRSNAYFVASLNGRPPGGRVSFGVARAPWPPVEPPLHGWPFTFVAARLRRSQNVDKGRSNFADLGQ